MDKKLTKEDVRTPDQMTQELGRFAAWISKNITLVIGVIVGLLVMGGIYTAVDYFNGQKESHLQGEMSRVEHQYTEKKTKFKDAEQAENAKKPASAKKDKNETPAPVLVKATGDLEKDYGPEVSGFEDLVAKNPNSKAGQMSAIYLADLYSEYKQPGKAIEALNKVAPQNEPTDVVSALVINLKAGLLADQGDCAQALQIWQKIMAQKKMDYLHDEAKLRSAVCYEKMNETAKAEQFYIELSKNTSSKDQAEDKAATEDAKKYLRLLKVRTNGGT